MICRVAVASSDGKIINQQFGRAGQFLVFDVSETEDKTVQFVVLRENKLPFNARQPDEEALAATVNMLADCQLVLANRIGLKALAALCAKGIIALEITDFIDDTLEKVANSLRRILPGRV